MRLIKLGDNAHTLETAGGALLFSYEGLAAVRLNADPFRTFYQGRGVVFRSPGVVLSVATRAHLQRFSPGKIPPALASRQFSDLCRRVLEAA